MPKRNTYWYDSIRIQTFDIVSTYALLHRLHSCVSRSVPFVQTSSEIKLSMMITITVNSPRRSKAVVRATHFRMLVTAIRPWVTEIRKWAIKITSSIDEKHVRHGAFDSRHVVRRVRVVCLFLEIFASLQDVFISPSRGREELPVPVSSNGSPMP